MTTLNPTYLSEAEWVTGTTPVELLRFLYGRVSDRKLRLFTCAVCRELDTEARCAEALNVAERYVDRQCALRLLHQAHHAVLTTLKHRWTPALEVAAAATAPLDVARLQQITALAAWVELATIKDVAKTWVERRRQQCNLLRELLGNLFRPPTIQANWKTWANGFVLRIAQTIYQEHRFQDMPELADALRQAGCCDPVLLGHAESQGPHVRGCWLLDSLLEKT